MEIARINAVEYIEVLAALDNRRDNDIGRKTSIAIVEIWPVRFTTAPKRRQLQDKPLIINLTWPHIVIVVMWMLKC
jgi:hypothetical protein